MNFKLSDVVQYKTLTFTGNFIGIAEVTGKVVITSIIDDNTKTTIDFSFDFSGCAGGIIGWLMKGKTITGTEGGLANMKRLSEEAQKKA